MVGCSLMDCEFKDVVNSEAYENIAPYYMSLFCAANTVAEVQSSGVYISMPVSTSVQFLWEKLS